MAIGLNGSGTRIGTGYIDVKADLSSLNRQVAAAGGPLSKAGSRIGTTLGRSITRAATIGVKAGAIGVAGGLVFAVKKAADFEQQLSSLGAVSDATGRQMDKFRKQALKAGADTVFSALEASKAQTELAKGGLTAQQILSGGLNSALALAAAGELDLADAASTTANAMNLFGIEGSKSVKVADQLAEAANATTADVGDFAIALSQGGSVAKAAGLDFTQTVLALEALAKTGIKNSDAGTSLKTALIQLIKPTAKQAELAKKLNLEFVDANGNFKSLADISEDLRDRLGGMTAAQRTATLATLAGTDGVRTLTSLYAAGPEKLNKWEKGLEKQGTAAEVAKRKQDNLKGSMEQLSGSVETLAIQIGSALTPTIREAADDLTDFGNDVGKILSRDDLTLGEKFDRAFKLARVDAKPWVDRIGDAIAAAHLPERLAGVFSASIPLMAEAAAKAAPRAVQAFVTGFRESSIWGKLIIAGFLLNKMGGLGAFRGLGARGGVAMGEGMATGAATTAGAQIPTRLGRLGGRMRAIGKGVLGLSLAAGIADAITSQNLSLGERIQRGVSTATLGILPDIRDVDERLNTITDRIRKFRGQNLGLNTGQADTSIIRKKDLEDFTGRQKRMLQGMADLRSAANRNFGPGTRLLSKAWLDPNRAIRDLNAIENAFVRLRSGVTTSLDDVAQTTERAFKGVRDTIGINSKEGRQQLTRNFDLATKEIGRFVREGKTDTAGGMKAIARLMKTYSDDGKNAVFKNFKELSPYIGRVMDKSGNLTQTGMDAIRLIMVNELQNLGLPKSAIRANLNKKASARKGYTQPGARGGTMGQIATGRRGITRVPGQGLQDSVPLQVGGAMQAVVAPGEDLVVANRHQRPLLDRAVSAAYGVRGLPGFFDRFKKPHAYQGGGIVALGRKLQREGYIIGENPAFGGVHPVHVPGSYHYKGQALDINADGFPGGEAAALDKLYARLKRLPGVVELLWRVAGHFDHLHVALAAGAKLGKFGGPLADIKLPDVQIEGESAQGLPFVAANRALDVYREAAQKKANDIAGTSLDVGEGPFVGGGDAKANRLLGKAMAARMFRWTGGEWSALDRLWTGESGWRNVMNTAGSGATGIPQALPGSKMASEGADWATNPATQIRWGLKYIRDRYGSPSSAYAQWLARDPHWYAQGGIPFGGRNGKDAHKVKDRPIPDFPGQTKKPLHGRLAKQLRQTLKRVGKSKTKNLDKQLGPFLKNLDRLGLPKKMLGKAGRLAADHARFADLATNADQLTVQNDDGTETLGVLQGLNTIGWLAKDLTAQFQLRNKLVDIRDVIVKRRSQVAQAFTLAQKRLKQMSTKGRTPSHWKGPNPVSAKVGNWNKLSRARRLKQMREFKRKRGILPGDREFLRDGRIKETPARTRKALERLVPKLKNTQTGLNEGIHGGDGVLTRLADLQGLSGPKGRLKSPWPLGTIPGGSIFQTQIDLRDRAAKPAVTDTSTGEDANASERASILETLLQQANLRTAVSERAFDVLRGFPPFGGVFHQGGVVPGPTGQERMVLTRAGERITPIGGDGTGGHYFDVRIEGKDARALNDLIDVRIERTTRDKSRTAGRPLPGRAGGRT